MIKCHDGTGRLFIRDLPGASLNLNIGKGVIINRIRFIGQNPFILRSHDDGRAISNDCRVASQVYHISKLHP